MSKRLAAAAMLATGAALMAGCGGTGPESAALSASPLPKSKARVKIHRESNIMGMAVDVRLMIDGKEVAGLSNDETEVFDLAPGTHHIAVDHWSHPGTSRLTLNAKPGMVYELKVAVRGEAAAAGMMFGIVGTAVESASSGDNGYWSIHVAQERPAA